MSAIPIEFFLFAAILGMVAFSHANTMLTALAGALVITVYKLLFSSFGEGAGLAGLAAHAGHEWVGLVNLLALLLGFALLAKHFEKSQVPAMLAQLPARRLEGAAGACWCWCLSFPASSTTSPPPSSAARWRAACSVAACIWATWPVSSPPPTPAVPAAWWATPRPP
jgi:hypothetical protein